MGLLSCWKLRYIFQGKDKRDHFRIPIRVSVVVKGEERFVAPTRNLSIGVEFSDVGREDVEIIERHVWDSISLKKDEAVFQDDGTVVPVGMVIEDAQRSGFLQYPTDLGLKDDNHRDHNYRTQSRIYPLDTLQIEQPGDKEKGSSDNQVFFRCRTPAVGAPSPVQGLESLRGRTPPPSHLRADSMCLSLYLLCPQETT